VRLERDTLVADVAQLRQTKGLESAAVGQDRAVPAHELVQAPEIADQVRARPQVEVVGVAQDDLRADFAELRGRERLHRALRADRHEDRRLDRPVAGAQPTPACRRGCIRFEQLELRFWHRRVLAAPKLVKFSAGGGKLRALDPPVNV